MSRYGCRSISESPLEFEITRVDCINLIFLNSEVLHFFLFGQYISGKVNKPFSEKRYIYGVYVH